MYCGTGQPSTAAEQRSCVTSLASKLYKYLLCLVLAEREYCDTVDFCFLFIY